MRREERRVLPGLGHEPAHGSVLVMGQAHRVRRGYEVRPAHRAVEQAAAREDRLLFAVVHDEREVRVGVPRRGDGLYGQGSHADSLAVGDGLALELHRVGGVHQVLRTVGLGELRAAGDVVVVQVGFSDMGDGHARFTGGSFHAVRVPLRIDDKAHRAVVHQVAPVPQLRGIDDNDVHGILLGGARRASRPYRTAYP